MENKKTIIYRSANNRKAAIDIYFTPKSKQNLVIFCHGFKSFRQWGYWPYLHSHFTAAGFAFSSFDFSHNGTLVAEPENFVDLQAFSKNSVSIEQQDIEEVIKAIKKETEKEGKKLDSISLIGHSRGGANAIVYAAKNPGIDKVVTWASISDFDQLLANFDKIEWKKNGVMYVENTRTGQQMPIDYSVFEDFLAHAKEYNVLQQVSLLKAPLLILHGENDTSVPLSQAKQLFDNCLHSIFIPVAGANHTFNTMHPWTGNGKIPLALAFALENTIEFLDDF